MLLSPRIFFAAAFFRAADVLLMPAIDDAMIVISPMKCCCRRFSDFHAFDDADFSPPAFSFFACHVSMIFAIDFLRRRFIADSVAAAIFTMPRLRHAFDMMLPCHCPFDAACRLRPRHCAAFHFADFFHYAAYGICATACRVPRQQAATAGALLIFATPLIFRHDADDVFSSRFDADIFAFAAIFMPPLR